MILKRIPLAVCASIGLLCAAAAQGWAATYYVASGVPTALDATVPAAGVDASGNGSITQPFRTIEYAAQHVSPGDTVIVRNGTYDEQVCFGYDMWDQPQNTQSGTATAWITFRAENLHRAFVHPDASVYDAEYGACFVFKSVTSSQQGQNATWSLAPNPVSYIRVIGFDLEDAGQVASGVAAVLAHHIVIANNLIHDNNSAGIAALTCDYFTIQDNQIYNNCRDSIYNGSGISMLYATGWDTQTAQYHNIIQRNLVYNNYIASGAVDLNGQPFAHTDGNGIIIDTSPYNVSTLIQNNVVYGNGGRGIHAPGSANIDILNNTLYHNNTDTQVDAIGEITTQEVTWAIGTQNYTNPFDKPSTNIKIWDNICCPLPQANPPTRTVAGLDIQMTSVNCNIQNNWLFTSAGTAGINYSSFTPYSNFPTAQNLSGCTINLNYGNISTNAAGPATDPLFVAPSIDTTGVINANFQLTSGSPCLDKSWSNPADDQSGYPRRYSWYDLGAMEYRPTVAIASGNSTVSAFAADKDFSGGSTAYYNNTIDTSSVTLPAPQSVYQGERYGTFTYTIPGLTAGAPYTVRLHFAETYFTAAGQRQFNVAINGTSVLANFDIVAKVGANRADIEQFTATANSSGQIVIAFTNGAANSPLVSGVEIIPNGISGTAIAAGASTASGVFVADKYVSGGSTATSSNAIDTSSVTLPAPQAVYQKQRYGNFTYTIPGLTAGSLYTVRLHFAETYWTSSGQRVFNVAINGTSVLSNFDVFSRAGANKADIEQFTATANASGQIVIAFTNGAADHAFVSGIEVFSQY